MTFLNVLNVPLLASAPVRAEGYWFSSALRFGGSFGTQLLLDVLVAAMALVLAVRLRHHRPLHGVRVWALCLVVGSLGVIAVSTLTRRSGATSPGHLQLEPLHTLRRYLYDPADLLIYLAGNVALFVPLGLFLYLTLRRWMLCAALATLVSIGVELAQLPIYSRATDIDDVITNGLGGLIGAVLGVLVDQAARRGWIGTWAQEQTQDVGTRLAAPGSLRTPDVASVSGRAASPWRP